MKTPFLSLLVLCAVLLSMSQTALALTPRTGEYTCRRLGEQTYSCLVIIKNQHVDEWASGVLDRYNDVDSTLEGMRIIVGNTYQQNAVIACDRFLYPLDTNKCLSAITNCRFSDSAVQECNRLESSTATIECFQFYCGK